MNLLNGLANHYPLTKITLTHLLKTMKLSSEVREDKIIIYEEAIREYFEKSFQVTRETSFQDFVCHDNGIEFIFHPKFMDISFLEYRLTFDVKLLSLSLTNEHQMIQFLISNIRLKSLNILSKLFQFYIRTKSRKLVVDELERVFREHQIDYERLFENFFGRMIYQISLMNIKQLDQLRERHLITGNRSILDIIQVTSVQHREQAVVVHYHMKESP